MAQLHKRATQVSEHAIQHNTRTLELKHDVEEMGPISELESVSINKTAAPSVGGQGAMRSARTRPTLGTRPNARSDARITMWHAAVWRGRAGQVLELGELGVADGTTAN
jgi:hypothetical protein